MLKNIMLAISISLLAVACGGGAAEEAKTADDAAKKDMPAADAKPAEGDAAKPAEGAAPAGDAAKPADAAAAPK
jgi:hypothetical protein